MPVELEQVRWPPKVMDTLFGLESSVSYANKALLPVYFPGRLRESEMENWEALETQHERVRQNQMATDLLFLGNLHTYKHPFASI
ncbi:hypothetical protein V8C35DRAFT_318526, partial [Trichoderma chlorosporum]